MSTSKIPRALIGGNWKCNGTLQQVAERAKWLNAAAASFPVTSEVVIAAPSVHLMECKRLFHPKIAVSAQDVGFKKGFGTAH